jgi:agmatinase
MLRPAAGGIFTVSTGAKEQLRAQQRIYGAQAESDIVPRWREVLERIADARVVILGVPSDAGAGFVRGANFAPQSLRRELLRRDSWLYHDPRVVDAGDVFVVPQLVHDEMLSAEQIDRSRRAIYGDDAGAEEWPVSPLSIAQSALEAIRSIAPAAAPLVLGGDHSVGWPALAAVARGRERETGILHFDAHTDLLESRLGIRYCFATWAYHANQLVGRGRRLAQVGIRISRRTRAHWEREHEVRQFWMEEVRARPVEDIADEIVSTMKAAGVRGVYVSNDIDGTDPLFGLATGTPEPGGLEPATVVTLIRRLGEAFPVWGSDLVEVAPPIAGHSPREPALTLGTAADYIEVQARASLG